MIRGIEHFYVPLVNAEAACDELTTTLGLPVAWRYRSYGASASGTSTAALVTELDARGVRHSQPVTYPEGAAEGHPFRWTVVQLAGLLGPDTMLISCEYLAAWARVEKARSRRLHACEGGALSVTGVVELTVGTTDHDPFAMWQRLFDPVAQVWPGCWEFEVGPRIRVVESDIDGVQRVVLGVRSVTAAKDRADVLVCLGGLEVDFVET